MSITTSSEVFDDLERLIEDLMVKEGQKREDILADLDREIMLQTIYQIHATPEIAKPLAEEAIQKHAYLLRNILAKPRKL